MNILRKAVSVTSLNSLRERSQSVKVGRVVGKGRHVACRDIQQVFRPVSAVRHAAAELALAVGITITRCDSVPRCARLTAAIVPLNLPPKDVFMESAQKTTGSRFVQVAAHLIISGHAARGAV